MSATGVGVSGPSGEVLGRGLCSGVGVLGGGQRLRGEGCRVQGCAGDTTVFRLGISSWGCWGGGSAWEKGCSVPGVVCGEGPVPEWPWTGTALGWVGSVGAGRGEEAELRCRVIVDGIVLGKAMK